jgi:hypothetical protein
MRSYWLDLSNPAHRILYKFGLSARGKNELQILKNLSHGNTNAYQLHARMKKKLSTRDKKLRYVDVHYSTVLRAPKEMREDVKRPTLAPC